MRMICLQHLCLLVGMACPLVATARIGETQEENQKRYGSVVPSPSDGIILSNATNQAFAYMGWQITAAYVDAKTARIRYRKGHMVEERVPQRLKAANEAGLLSDRQAKKRGGLLSRLNLHKGAEDLTSVSVFKAEPLSSEEVKSILKSEFPIGNWREYDPKTQSRSAVFSFSAKEVPATLINDYGVVAHTSATRVILDKLATTLDFEKQASQPKAPSPAIPKF